ncbi:hypothetical protein [Micromonospora sp. NPDC048830]|uniref:hypothetical protein n=1 Tax=Micromonospora sp. NPDC048830 TaxID=3364257 RepID=UPI003710595D
MAGAVARLRADGHHVLRVRSDAALPDAPVPPEDRPVVGLPAPVDSAAAEGGSAPPGDEPGGAVHRARAGGPVSALVRLRLAAFLRTGRAVAPLLAGLLVLGVLYGGGRAEPAEAYGVSAVVLFPGGGLERGGPGGLRLAPPRPRLTHAAFRGRCPRVPALRQGRQRRPRRRDPEHAGGDLALAAGVA